MVEDESVGMEELTIERLTRGEVLTAATFGREQAMAIVGLYYWIQKARVAASTKVSAHNRRVDVLSDSALVVRLKQDLHKIERQAARGLKAYAESQQLGRWAMSNIGIGPVITAGLLAHIDIARAPTAGAIWRFAGLDPTCKWNRGEKRPYNAALKRLCWLLGDCLKKASSHPWCFYGHLYLRRKEQEVARDLQGVNADLAEQRLDEARKKGYGISPEQKAIWQSGHLQAVGLDRRAMRYAVKIFLSHYHWVGRTLLTGKAPEPWVIAHGGHIDWIPPHNWPMVGEE